MGAVFRYLTAFVYHYYIFNCLFLPSESALVSSSVCVVKGEEAHSPSKALSEGKARNAENQPSEEDVETVNSIASSGVIYQTANDEEDCRSFRSVQSELMDSRTPASPCEALQPKQTVIDHHHPYSNKDAPALSGKRRTSRDPVKIVPEIVSEVCSFCYIMTMTWFLLSFGVSWL
ncbi:hypothetical protein ANCCAN_04708 [Ancylostoma caninum]|uniref:Uncharacterized protein n=1 Tax=Ancylostoma caninum TaxID=29170 RepID=A0A368GXQ7_ANCCA|nr:hypothetical protein ANCCAN_04708 [Ancylostoma caninum]